jgi:3-phytase
LANAVPLQIRVATYNASLNRNTQGQLATDLSTRTNAQARQVAEILQRVRPDIVLINEFDYDADGVAAQRFHDNYLAVAQNGQAPLSYPHRYVAPANTGITSGFDLDNVNGYVATAGTSTTTKNNYGEDCLGFGWFPGQYSFVLYSRFPILTTAIRTFQSFKWKDMPGAALPDQSGTPAPADWYSTAELNVVRLSSKNHCDLPIEVTAGHVVHLLASHPTPPSFDGVEDRNGRRNHDEIRLWADYISGAAYLYDDAGQTGGLSDAQRFIILGDLNADPVDGDSYQNAVNQLRNHPLVNSAFNPASPGGPQQAQKGGVNNNQRGDPAFDTADFNDFTVGNLRVDHLLPSKLGLSPTAGGIFWPLESDPTFPLVNASDHRLVWLNVTVTPIVAEAVRKLRIGPEGRDIVLNWGTQIRVSYKVQTSYDLIGWTDAPQIAITLDTAAELARAADPDALNATQKFYRLVTTIDESAAGSPAPQRLRRATRLRK